MTAQDHRLAEVLKQRQQDEQAIQDKLEAERAAVEAAAAAQEAACKDQKKVKDWFGDVWDKLTEPETLLKTVIIAVGVVAAVVAIGAIIAVSGGLATPLVVGVMMSTGLGSAAATAVTVAGIGAFGLIGAGTAAMSVADIVENQTGNNIIKEKVFGGNDEAYNNAEQIGITISLMGTMFLAPYAQAGYSSLGNSYEVNANKPMQNHHFVTDKNKTYTPQFEKTLDKYDMSLDSSWNIESMPHQGRHPNAYHDYMLEQLQAIDKVANRDKAIFMELFNALKQEIVNNPDMLYKDFWGK